MVAEIVLNPFINFPEGVAVRELFQSGGSSAEDLPFSG